MLKLNSKQGTVSGKPEAVYTYLADFRNFAHLLPAERLNDVEIAEHTLKFSIDGLGHVGLKMAGMVPYSQLVINAIEGSPADFTFRIHIAEASPSTSNVDIHLDANLNMFLEMMAKGPLQHLLDMMIDKLETVQFS
jgi:carbon monoxide dehydrogenase subunit G